MNPNQALLTKHSKMSEQELQDTVVELAGHLGYIVREPAADKPNKAAAAAGRWDLLSDPGWPDLWLGHPDTGINGYIELKTESGMLDPEQKIILALLADVEQASGGMFFVRLWRPRHWVDDTIMQELMMMAGRGER